MLQYCTLCSFLSPIITVTGKLLRKASSEDFLDEDEDKPMHPLWSKADGMKELVHVVYYGMMFMAWVITIILLQPKKVTLYDWD